MALGLTYSNKLVVVPLASTQLVCSICKGLIPQETRYTRGVDWWQPICFNCRPFVVLLNTNQMKAIDTVDTLELHNSRKIKTLLAQARQLNKETQELNTDLRIRAILAKLSEPEEANGQYIPNR